MTDTFTTKCIFLTLIIFNSLVSKKAASEAAHEIHFEPKIIVRTDGRSFTSAQSDAGASLRSMLAQSLDMSWHVKSVKEFCDNNLSVKKMIIGGIVVTYGYVLYELQTMQHYLADDLWSDWRDEMSIEKLFTIPDDGLMEDLLFAIQRRYSAVTDVDNYILPIKKFFEDVREEKRILDKYNQCIKVITKLPLFLPRLFFIDKELVNSIHLKKQRLSYLEGKMQTYFANKKSDKCINS